MSTAQPYQLCGELRPEERAALAADIAKRGVLIPVEKDTEGNILLGLSRAPMRPFKEMVRRGHCTLDAARATEHTATNLSSTKRGH